MKKMLQIMWILIQGIKFLYQNVEVMKRILLSFDYYGFEGTFYLYTTRLRKRRRI